MSEKENKIDPNLPVKLRVIKGRTVPGTSQYTSERADFELEMTTTMGTLDATRTMLEAKIEEWLPKMPLPQPAPVQPTPTPAPPSPTPAGNKNRTKEDVAKDIGELSNMLSFEYSTDGQYIKIKPKQFLGSDNFAVVAGKVRGMGGEYISAGKDSHFRVYRNK